MSGSTRSYEFAKRFVEKGCSVTIITADRVSAEMSSSKIRWEIVDGINVCWLPVLYSNSMGFWRRILAFIKFSILSCKVVYSLHYDVVYATSTPLTIALPGVFAKWRRKVPMLFEVRDLWPAIPIALGILRNPLLIFIAKFLERFAYWQADHIIALSPDMAKDVARISAKGKKVTVIPNSCDIDLFSEKSLVELPNVLDSGFFQNKEILLYPGTIGYVNGVSYLVRLAKELKSYSTDICIVVMGSGAEHYKVQLLAEELEVWNDVFFIFPSVEKHLMPSVFAKSTAIFSTVIDVPELFANSANKFFDSLAAGKPIFINYLGWQGELIIKERLGAVLDRNEALAAQQVWSLLQNKNYLSEISKNCLRVAKQDFSRDACATALLGLMGRSLESKSV